MARGCTWQKDYKLKDLREVQITVLKVIQKNDKCYGMTRLGHGMTFRIHLVLTCGWVCVCVCVCVLWCVVCVVVCCV